MNCFGGRVSHDLYQNCCNSNTLCEFNGDLSHVDSQPIYVQKVFDAVLFNMQGMKTVQNTSFSPAVPQGHRVKRVVDIRCRKSFNPCNVDDPCNLKLDVNTSISGATFLKGASGDYLQVVGADGTFSEKILYAETSDCDDQCKGTPIFGTQNIAISGNVIIELDLLLCDPCNNDSIFTVSADVNIAEGCQPLVLTNFFEICMPSTIDTAFLPRFTEFCNSACEARLATNNCGRDLSIDCNGCITGNLIIAICVTCEKKIVVPVQLCVLSTGYVQPAVQHNTICSSFPSLFPNRVEIRDSEQCISGDGDDDDCGYGGSGNIARYGGYSGGGSSCGCGCDDGHHGHDDCNDSCDCSDGHRPSRPQPRR